MNEFKKEVISILICHVLRTGKPISSSVFAREEYVESLFGEWAYIYYNQLDDLSKREVIEWVETKAGEETMASIVKQPNIYNHELAHIIKDHMKTLNLKQPKKFRWSNAGFTWKSISANFEAAPTKILNYIYRIINQSSISKVDLYLLYSLVTKTLRSGSREDCEEVWQIYRWLDVIPTKMRKPIRACFIEPCFYEDDVV
jgi:hypothetical protein